MRISIAISLLILLLAAVNGIPQYQQLAATRASHAKLVASAAQLGISIDLTDPIDQVRITKRDRENKAETAKHVAEGLIAFHKESASNGDSSPDETRQKLLLEQLERVLSLDAAQLKILIAEIRAAADLTDQARQELLSFPIITLAADHPQVALALLLESPDLFAKNGMERHVVSSSLTKWAKEDPLGAMEWIKKNAAKFPDLITTDAKNSFIASAATQDPKLAFKLIGELGIQKNSDSISSIVRAAETQEDRTTTLAALREHLATLQDGKTKQDLSNDAMRSFSRSLDHEEFEVSARWIAASNFTPAELVGFADGLSNRDNGKQNGEWIEWVGEKLPTQEADQRIRNLVRNWTTNDYQAAGQWLTSIADGPTKHTAIHSYAETIAPYEPAVAAQWAVTLPPGQKRQETLGTIYRRWPGNDPTGKETFKQQHGIK